MDFARLGSASYVEAKKLNPQVSLLLAQNGKVRSYIFALADSGIQSNADLNGKSVAFVDDSSTTGNFLPKRALFVFWRRLIERLRLPMAWPCLLAFARTQNINSLPMM